MRTTLDLDDDLLRRARIRAAEESRTLTSVVEDALRRELAGTPAQPPPFRLRLLTRRGRLVPGVDLSDRDSLLERMDGRS